MKNKRLIILVAIVVIILIIIVKVASSKDNNNETTKKSYAQLQEDGTMVNTSQKLAENKTYNGLEFTNIKFTNSSSATYLNADVKNTTQNSTKAQVVDVNILDEQGNVIATFVGQISALEPGESTIINSGITGNYVDAYNIEFVKPAAKTTTDTNTNQVNQGNQVSQENQVQG